MRKLTLIHNFDGHQEFQEGVNCDRITRLDDGAYLLERGNREDTLPGTFGVLTQIPRPGIATEPQPSEPTTFKHATRVASGWRCKACPFESSTVHGVKVHHSRTHVG